MVGWVKGWTWHDLAVLRRTPQGKTLDAGDSWKATALLQAKGYDVRLGLSITSISALRIYFKDRDRIFLWIKYKCERK